MNAYPIIMAFISKHLPKQPYIEGMQRFSLGDKILREVVLNSSFSYPILKQHRRLKTTEGTENHSGLSRIQSEILKKLKENLAYSRRELANVIENASLGGVISALSRLQELGIIRRIGPDKGGHWEIIGILQD